MKRGDKITIAFIAFVVLIALLLVALQIWLRQSPLVVMGDPPSGELVDRQTAVGQVFAELLECGYRQKDLYGCLEAYREKHGRLPQGVDELINSVHEAMSFDDCPAGLSGYVVHFENWGKPDAVLIEEAENKHRTTFKLWIRDIHPKVQTMGDGKIYLFDGGKLATIDARKK